MGFRASRTRVVAAAVALAMVAGACGSDGDDAAEDASGEPVAAGVVEGEPFPAARCEANKAAGKITFLTSFDYAAAASIIDVVAAQEQGYFEQLCLDVALQGGFSSDNVGVVSAGRAQMTSLGSFSEVAVANSQGAGLVAVAVEGKTSIEALLVETASGITSLKQLEGRQMGIKGAIPYSLRAMLAEEGVDEAAIKQIEVGFNPVVLFETEIEALPVYKSNEPGQLDAAGYAGKYTVFDPKEAKIPASFAVITTSQSFASEHPTAVADFVRATLKGFEWAAANPEAAVEATLKRSDPNLFFNPDGETFRWKTEAALVKETTKAGTAVGSIDQAALQQEVDALVSLGVVDKGKVDVASSIDASIVGQVTKGDKVIWPAAS